MGIAGGIGRWHFTPRPRTIFHVPHRRALHWRPYPGAWPGGALSGPRALIPSRTAWRRTSTVEASRQDASAAATVSRPVQSSKQQPYVKVACLPAALLRLFGWWRSSSSLGSSSLPRAQLKLPPPPHACRPEMSEPIRLPVGVMHRWHVWRGQAVRQPLLHRDLRRHPRPHQVQLHQEPPSRKLDQVRPVPLRALPGEQSFAGMWWPQLLLSTRPTGKGRGATLLTCVC